MSGPSGKLDLSWSLHSSLASGAHNPGPTEALEDISEAETPEIVLLKNNSREVEAHSMRQGIARPTPGLPKTHTHTHTTHAVCPGQVFTRAHSHTPREELLGENVLQQCHLVGAGVCPALPGFPCEPQGDGLKIQGCEALWLLPVKTNTKQAMTGDSIYLGMSHCPPQFPPIYKVNWPNHHHPSIYYTTPNPCSLPSAL